MVFFGFGFDEFECVVATAIIDEKYLKPIVWLTFHEAAQPLKQLGKYSLFVVGGDE